jgi:hypothetical protein
MQRCSLVIVGDITRDYGASLDLKGGLTPMRVKRSLCGDSMPLPGKHSGSTSQTLSSYYLCLTLRSNRFDG